MATCPVISVSRVDDAIGDGILVEVVRARWQSQTGGGPLVVTADVSRRQEVEPGLAEDVRHVVTSTDGSNVWVIEEGVAFTILYPEEYGRRPGRRAYETIKPSGRNPCPGAGGRGTPRPGVTTAMDETGRAAVPALRGRSGSAGLVAGQ